MADREILLWLLLLRRVKGWMDRLLWDREQHPEDIYRVKGVLHVRGDPRKHMLQVSGNGWARGWEGGAGAVRRPTRARSQASARHWRRCRVRSAWAGLSPRRRRPQAVYELYNVTASAPWLEGEKRLSRVVIIGRQLNKESLEKWFASLAAA